MLYPLHVQGTDYRAAAIHVLGPHIWNSLSNYFKEVKHIPTFKKEMKLIYLLKYNELRTRFLSMPAYINIHRGHNTIKNKMIILKLSLYVITLSVFLC